MTNLLRRLPAIRRAPVLGLVAILALGSIAGAAGGPTYAAPAVVDEHASSSIDEHIASPTALPIAQARYNIISLTNRQRMSRGLPALRSSNALNNACQAHADDMARRRTLTHTGSDGSNGGQRARRYGLGWRTWGENVAAGQRGSAEVVNAWMASSSHRANILNGQFNAVGVGLQQASNGTIYFCQLFVRTA